jgi:hypothetical protein
MKKILLILVVFFYNNVKAEEQLLQIIFSGNIENVPIQIDNVKKDTKNIINLTLNNWSVSPKPLSLIKSKYKQQKIRNENQFIAIKIKYKF